MSHTDAKAAESKDVTLDLPDDFDEEHEVVAKPTNKNKLTADHLLQFGFNDVDDYRSLGGKGESSQDARGGGAHKKSIRGRKSKNANVVYGATDDDDDDADYNQDYGQDYAVDSDSDSTTAAPSVKDGGLPDADASQDQLTEGVDLTSFGLDIEELWEDEEAEEDEPVEELDEEALLEAERSALFAAELERERMRNIRIAEIMRKKEALLERYLKTAKIMIGLRKKNIYLQDYLYHLALRKGVLRGDLANPNQTVVSADGEIDENATASQILIANAQKTRQQKKQNTMSMRFARFLRKTGHLFDDDQSGEFVHHRHNHHHGKLAKMDHNDPLRTRLSRGFNIRKSQFGQMRGTAPSRHTTHQHHHHKRISKQLIHNRDCPGAPGCDKPKKKKHKRRKFRDNRGAALVGHALAEKRNRKRMSIRELLERKAETQIKEALKKADEALNVMETHRCKMKRQRQIIKIADLLYRQYNGIILLEKERNHLVNFVEHSVKAQNLAKRKALRRQQKNQSIEQKKSGGANMNHQWIKSLERIRDLRLKKAKLEKEHRIQLIKKVHHWSQWEKRDELATESVYDFVFKMGSKVTAMSKRETESFNTGLDQFQKQLKTLREAMFSQLVRLFKAKSMLYMAQRRVKDDARVASPAVKGFSIADFERMSIENHESHQKLLERQIHLVDQHEKLQKYMGKVATGHITKQRTYGALRAGRHDLKLLWEMCLAERDNLAKKFRDIRRVKKLHKRLFVQIAVLENKRLYKDFARIYHRVEELKDKKRVLTTRLHHNNCNMRVLSTKMTDTKQRLRYENKRMKAEALKNDMDFYKSTIQQRLHPRLPHTVHDINMMNRDSMYKILEPDIKDAINRTIITTADKPPPVPSELISASMKQKKSRVKKIKFGSGTGM